MGCAVRTASETLLRYNGAAVRILVVGTGGVGSAFAGIARRRSFFEHCALADNESARPESVVAGLDDGRFTAHRIDASSRDDVGRLIRDTSADAVLNAVDPVFNMPIFEACLEARVTYLDMALSLSQPHPERPHEETRVKLGDEQFEQSSKWEEAELLALVGIGVEPEAADVFARHAADELFSEIDEVGVRDGSNLVVDGYEFAPTFSIWTTIEECLNPPVLWERHRGWFTTEPFSEPEVFGFPEGIGPVECVNVEHEEVLLVPRFVDCKRVTFKYGLGDEFIEVLTNSTSSASTRRRGSRSKASRSRRETSSRRRSPTRRHSVTAWSGRPAPGRS
ncbi:MAG: saccharopine dehydrogenase NADP-binding domain-containing protein [Gaiellaceae bacterium]